MRTVRPKPCIRKARSRTNERSRGNAQQDLASAGGSLQAVTGGHDTISDIFVGKYDKVFAKSSAGFDPAVKTVHITPGTNVVDWQLRRDWAVVSVGGQR